jgi:hypothetical protein
VSAAESSSNKKSAAAPLELTRFSSRAPDPVSKKKTTHKQTHTTHKAPEPTPIMLLLSSSAAAAAARAALPGGRRAAARAVAPLPPHAFVRSGSGGGAPNPPASSSSGGGDGDLLKGPPSAVDPAAAAKALAAKPPAAAPAPAAKPAASRRRTSRRTAAAAPTEDGGSSSSSPSGSSSRSGSPGTSRRTRTKTATADGTAAAAGPKRQRARSRSPAGPVAAAEAAATTPAAAAKPASAPAAKKAASSVVPIGFLTQRRVQYGLEVAVVGESDALGGWDPSQAVPLRWCEGDVWAGRAMLPAAPSGASAVELAYKLIVRAPDGTVVQWQPSDNRVVQVPVGGGGVGGCPERRVPAEAAPVLQGVEVAVEDAFDGASAPELVRCVVAGAANK